MAEVPSMGVAALVLDSDTAAFLELDSTKVETVLFEGEPFGKEPSSKLGMKMLKGNQQRCCQTLCCRTKDSYEIDNSEHNS